MVVFDDKHARAAEKFDADKFIEKVKNANTERFDALGEGDDLRLSGEAMTGGALLAEGRIVHLVAFDIRDGNKQDNYRARRYYNGPFH